jgi:hypothetical protein
MEGLGSIKVQILSLLAVASESRMDGRPVAHEGVAN